MKNGFRKLLILLLVTCLVSVSACSSVSNLVDSVTGGGSKGETVTMENGATVFRPGDEDIAEDAETGIPYLKGIILAYTLKSPDETLQKKLEKEADGKIVGVQSGIVPMVEIKTKAEGYSDLQALAEKIEAMPDVLIAAPEIVFEFQMEAVNTITQDQTPWAKTGEDPIADEDKGNENQPGGNDRWAEEIRAYSAWDALPELANPLPVGVMDSGIDTEHPEFENRIFLASKNDINNHDDHGTFVSGIIGASGDNNRFVRGIADRSSIYFADTNNGIVGAFYNDSPTPIINSYLTYRETPASVCSYYSYMRSKGVRVINHSFGNNYILTPYEFNNIDKFINDPAYSKLKEAGEELKQKVAKYSDYTDYFQHTLYYAEQSANYLLLYMLVEIANGNDDFLYVQSAGNGSFFQDTPVSSDLNLYFCSIREEKFNEVLLNLREAYEDPEIKERLNHLTWEEFRSHIIIVGGTDEKTAPTADYSLYSSSNYGDGVDLCAPAVNIYGINLSGVANHESCSEETGTSCAAPMVTGSATLLWSAFPDFPASEIKKILTECTDNKVPDEKMTTELFKK
ncbi:MAG: S8 family serine peptidase, partial [Clostridia bacterium]|nr:S8 family serine peptidase [Clostridia bacterium]